MDSASRCRLRELRHPHWQVSSEAKAAAEAGLTRASPGAISAYYIPDATADSAEPVVQDHVQIMSQHGGPPASPLTIYAQAIAETTVHTARDCL